MARSTDEQERAGAYRVQRDRGGFPWLWALLGVLALLALAAVVWWVADEGEDMDVGTTPPGVEDTTAPSGAIRDVSAFANANAATLEGRAVDLRSATVVNALSDKLFIIGSSSDPVFVSVGAEATTPGPTEGRLDINDGNRVRISGEVRTVASAAEAQRMFGIDSATADRLAREGFYIHTGTIQKLG